MQPIMSNYVVSLVQTSQTNFLCEFVLSWVAPLPSSGAQEGTQDGARREEPRFKSSYDDTKKGQNTCWDCKFPEGIFQEHQEKVGSNEGAPVGTMTYWG